MAAAAIQMMVGGGEGPETGGGNILEAAADAEEEQPICGEYEMYTLVRFLCVSFASLLALLGLAANLFLFGLFSTRQSREGTNTPATLYPRVLALLDACICAVYILLFGADAAVVYLRSQPLFLLYHMYIVPTFVLARIAQLAIPYMLIFASLERLVWCGGKLRNPLLRRMYSQNGRSITVAFTLLACACLRLPTAWATTVHQYPKCHDFFRTQTAGPADWVLDSRFYQFYDFHLLSIAQTVFPFFLLLAINLVVIHKVSQVSHFAPVLLRQKSSSTASSTRSSTFVAAAAAGSTTTIAAPGAGQPPSRIHRKSSLLIHRLVLNRPVRSAIYTMVCIVCSYLVSNSLHLALTMLEKSNSHLLRDPDDPSLASTFHTAFSDLVSFVYMFTSAIRFLIYYACNAQMRAQIRQYLCCQRQQISGEATKNAVAANGKNHDGGAVPPSAAAQNATDRPQHITTIMKENSRISRNGTIIASSSCIIIRSGSGDGSTKWRTGSGNKYANVHGAETTAAIKMQRENEPRQQPRMERKVEAESNSKQRHQTKDDDDNAVPEWQEEEDDEEDEEEVIVL